MIFVPCLRPLSGYNPCRRISDSVYIQLIIIMAISLSDLCSRPDDITSFVMQGERRQTPDRRRTRRGGRRADDLDAVDDPVDLRAIAIRRVSAGARVLSSQASDR